MLNKLELINQAQSILKTNDYGGYTVPTKSIYPFQWNWDSAITALGWMTFDEERAWLELKTLLKGQWSNGMIPHIIFHKESDSYFPDADFWGTKTIPQTSAISQPPILSSMVALMFKTAKQNNLALQEIKELLPSLIKYHLWWYKERDPLSEGLVVSYHPWESGMDNSPAWDKSISSVPSTKIKYKRKDTSHVDPEERPTQSEYDRYVYLVDFYNSQNFDSTLLFENCPYKMYDIGIISTLHKATQDLIWLCNEANITHPNLAELSERLELTEKHCSKLWSEKHSAFLNKDAITSDFCEELTTGTLLSLYAGLPNKEQASKISNKLDNWFKQTPYGLASTHPKSSNFEPQRYWRGPIWLHINWLIAQGFEKYGFKDFQHKIKSSSLSLVENYGFYEYYNSETGKGCGGNAFSWTAATALYWLL